MSRGVYSKWFTHTFESKCDGSMSVIDHFLFSKNLFVNICDYMVKLDGHNLSDHCPVTVLVEVSALANMVSSAQSNLQKRKLKWYNASEEDLNAYQEELHQLLATVQVPDAVRCENLKCSVHFEEINTYYSNIINACLDAADRTIPSCDHSSGSQNKSLPG